MKAWVDEVAGFAPAEAEQDSSLAAIVSTVADGYPAGGDEKAVIGLALITRLLERKATWAQIGAVQGISGREAKRRAHKLRIAVQRLAVAADAGSSEGGGLGCGP